MGDPFQVPCVTRQVRWYVGRVSVQTPKQAVYMEPSEMLKHGISARYDPCDYFGLQGWRTVMLQLFGLQSGASPVRFQSGCGVDRAAGFTYSRV